MVIIGWPRPEFSEYWLHRRLAWCLSLEQQMGRRLTQTYVLRYYTWGSDTYSSCLGIHKLRLHKISWVRTFEPTK
jgi:hypothetical protein